MIWGPFNLGFWGLVDFTEDSFKVSAGWFTAQLESVKPAGAGGFNVVEVEECPAEPVEGVRVVWVAREHVTVGAFGVEVAGGGEVGVAEGEELLGVAGQLVGAFELVGGHVVLSGLVCGGAGE